MKLLKQPLSPLILKRENNESTEPLNDEIILAKQITTEKIQIINNSLTPSQLDLIRPEILESWMRSKHFGLNLLNFNYGPTIEKTAFEDLQNKNALLMKAANPHLRQLTSLISSPCMIALSDEKGVMLQININNNIFKKVIDDFNFIPGVIWSEETIGTCSHSLSLLYRIPVQLSAPEHYCETYNSYNLSSSSAPIIDINNNVIGTIILISSSLYLQNAHSLALVASVAEAIQRELHLISNRELFSVVLEAADEAMIIINTNGQITKANNHAVEILGYPMSNLIGTQIEDILGKQAFIKTVLETGKPISDTEIYLEKRNQKLYLRSARTVADYYGRNSGCVLILRKPQTLIKKVTATSGLITKFNFEKIKGQSPQLMQSINLAKKFAVLDGNILIQGESGTGKEMFAQSIHNENNPNGPFIAINCTAIPKDLIESELFGYEGGAFTGAERQGHKGKIELANGGTLFLDEIGDMPLSLQPILLRVLEEKQVMRIGGNYYIPVNFRLIAATNQNLLNLVEKKQFREDLYYRLDVFSLSIPPLRDRGNDIIELANHFIASIAEKQQKPAPTLDEAAIYRLLRYNWPGNVRQLQNAMLYAVSATNDDKIKPENLPTTIRESTVTFNRNPVSAEKVIILAKDNTDDRLSMKEMEKKMIIQSLLQTENNITKTARLLEISKSTLYRKLKEYNLLNEIRK
ncbi:sigma-54-dependent Fis family transcriptional regulator [Desulfitobacterium sp. Sab5]|uniref:sigma-54-dependent Fis family transcriptional regulator n=1 Tax=Desulfitobacterium nosdiversum TaxID=3375356 RepID=UPI003CECE8AF